MISVVKIFISPNYIVTLLCNFSISILLFTLLCNLFAVFRIKNVLL